jgi:hypothetical protein
MPGGPHKKIGRLLLNALRKDFLADFGPTVRDTMLLIN